MVPEGEAQPDNPEQQVLLEVQKSSKITCGSYLEERQQDHVGSPMAAGARRAAREERERKRGEGNRVVRGAEEEDQAGPATMTSRAFRRGKR